MSSFSPLAGAEPSRTAWRLTPVLMLGVLALALFAILSALPPSWGSALPVLGPSALDVHAGIAASVVEAMHRAVRPGSLVLSSAWGLLGVLGLALAVTQRHRADAVFGVSALVWGANAAMVSVDVPGSALSLLRQSMMVVAMGTLLWYGVQRFRLPADGMSWSAFWPAWAIGILTAGLLSWSRGVDESSGPWLVPMTCLAAGVIVVVHTLFVRMSQASRDGDVLAIWWVAIWSAVAAASGASEVWLRMSAPTQIEVRATLWLLTRVGILVMMVGLFVWRLHQLARTSHHLGRSHRQWRTRLRGVQAEVQDLQRGLGLREMVAQQALQRDQIARDMLDDLARGLSLAGLPADPARGDALAAVAWVRDSLDMAPRSIDRAVGDLGASLQARAAAVGGALSWHVDATCQAVVLPPGETLLWQRLVTEAIGVAIDLGWVRGPLALSLGVQDGETGRFLALDLHGAPMLAGELPLHAGEPDLFGERLEPAYAQCRARLQRLATALGAQLVLDLRPGEPVGLEVVQPIKGR